MRSMHPRRTLLGALGLALVLGGVVSGALAATTKPGLTLQISPASASVARGQSAGYTVSVTSTGGFTGTVTLSASGLPSGATASFGPASVTLASGATATSALSVATTSSTPVGSYTVTVTGSSGKTSGSVAAGLTVNYPLSGALTVTAAPNSVTLSPGSTAVYTVALTRNNLAGPVAFSVAGGLPGGAAATFSPNPTTGNSSTLQVATSSTSATGTYSLYLVSSGADSTGTTRYAYANVQLVLSTSGKSFTIAGTAAGLLAPGVTQPVNLTLTNPNSQTLSVTNLTVTVQSVTRAASATGTCSTADYAVVQYRGPYPLSVPANSSSTLSGLGVAQQYWPQLQMIDAPTNQDGCKGAAVALAYAGSGQGS